MKNPYVVLGISNTASIEEIKQVFRRLAKESHPDMNSGSNDSISRFHEISEAYAFLMDPNKRKKFDEATKNINSNEPNYRYNYKGWQEDFLDLEIIRRYIATIINELLEYKKMATKATNTGLAWFLSGAVISFVSYQSAINSGSEQYFVATGAILFGGIQVVKGMIASAKINKYIEEVEKELWENVDKHFYKNAKTSSSNSEQQKTEYSKPTNAESRENNSSSETETEKYESNKQPNRNYDKLVMDETNNNAKQDSRNGGLLVIIIIAIVIIAISTSQLNTGNNYAENEPKIETENNEKSKDNILLANSDRHDILRVIDVVKAENFTKQTYKNSEVDNIIDIFINLGYPLDESIQNDMNELIVSIAHYQKLNRLVVDGMAGAETMKSIAITVSKSLIGMEVEDFIRSDLAIKKSYGWNAKKVNDFTYFVTYEFDYDNSRDNGWNFYAYELDLVTGIFKLISSDLELENKYRELGFIN